MIAFDTNFLLRWLLGDDVAQTEEVRKVVAAAEDAGEQVFLPVVVIAETAWFLSRRRKASRSEQIAHVRALLDDPLFLIQHREEIEVALEDFSRGKAGYCDYLIGALASPAGARTTYTFDRALGGSNGFTVSSVPDISPETRHG